MSARALFSVDSSRKRVGNEKGNSDVLLDIYEENSRLS